MKYAIAMLALLGMMLLLSCAKKETAQTPSATAEPAKAETPAPAESDVTSGPRVFVRLKNGTSVPGTVVASSKTDLVLAGEDGIERKIPLGQVRSVDYAEEQTSRPAGTPDRAAAPAKEPAAPKRAAAEPKSAERRAQETADRAEPAARSAAVPAVSTVTSKTFELPAGSDISVRTNEAINSETAAEGQTFDAQVTRDAKDANGDVVIPRGSNARVVIRSASKGGKIRGASDLALDLQSVTINGRQHTVDTVDVTKQGKSGVGANRRTAEYTGGGAALGAIIGAIAGGGKGAAIGAGAGAGAGALTQILTKGRAIKVPVESVLTFSLDKPLKVVER